MDAGLIRESDKKVDREIDDERRVYYKVTGLGKKALAAELTRYREVVAVAKQNRLSPNDATQFLERLATDHVRDDERPRPEKVHADRQVLAQRLEVDGARDARHRPAGQA